MAEVMQYNFEHKDVIETLIRKQDLHDGVWTISFQLGMGVTKANSPTGGDPVPAAVVSILSVGLQKVDKEGPLAVDAAKVNPAKK